MHRAAPAHAATSERSVPAEHGIAMMRRTCLEFSRSLEHSRSAKEIDLVCRLKNTLDPKWISNPGRVL